MSRKKETTAEQQQAQYDKVQSDVDFLNEINNMETAKALAAEQPTEATTAEAPVMFEDETPLMFNYIEWVKGEPRSLRFVGMVTHPDNEARVPGIFYMESEAAKDERGQYKNYYLFEELNSEYKPTGVYWASNEYWHLQEWFVEKINALGVSLTNYALIITQIDEIEKKGRQPIKIFNVQRSKQAFLPTPKQYNS